MGAEGLPTSRAISVKACDERGLLLFGNLEARKGRDLQANPKAAATFYWPILFRQVNVTGHVEYTDDDESDALWARRSLEGQRAASVARQGEPLSDRSELEREVQALATADTDLERPVGSSGFVLVPSTIEFWLGQRDLLHRRLHYSREEGRWTHWFLQP